jgi:pimeloyl-ACP methyl ester carboxylesterase
MQDRGDQHRIVLMPGVVRGGHYPAVLGFHGQPERGQLPRDYEFFRTVTQVTLELGERERVGPLVLVLPVFRFAGQNWPAFDLVEFSAEVARVLDAEGIRIDGYYLFGHSAGAGCGGDGLNRAHRLRPRAVGFFDTCVGAGFGAAVAALRRDRVPILIVHSVETAGFRPRPPLEYWPRFDFGKVYAPLGLKPTECPERLPEVPLRAQPYRCAADPEGTTRALVVDTGEGQAGHDAVIPVALRYFLQEYLGRTP